MATELTVTVAAGAKAISGATLASELSSTFTTPAISITGTYPTVKLRPDSPLVVRFDQAIDPAKIVKYLRVEDGKKKKLAFDVIGLPAAKSLWQRNPSIKLDNTTLDGHYLVLAPKTPWPSGIEGRVVLGKGAPSAEGARVTTQETGATFDVAPRFNVRGVECDEISEPRISNLACAAWSYLTVRFSNDIDKATYRPAKLQIVGRGLEDNTVNGDGVTIDTPRTVGTAYTIQVAESIKDVYGQPLGGVRQLAFTTKPYRNDPYLSAHGGMYILDPRWEIPQWVVHTQAIETLKIELYQVQPSDYFAYQDYEAGKLKTPPGKRIYSKEHPVGAKYGASARVDLRPALSAAGTGHVIAVATTIAAAGKKLPVSERSVRAWIQVSRIGLTARIDGERINAWAQDITPATFLKPISGVSTSLVVERRSDAPPPVTTDAQGHVAYELLPYIPPKPNVVQDYPTALVLAASPTDSTFTAIQTYEKTQRTESARWYVTDDRFTYKPGETVYVKGWVRWTDNGVNPDLHVPGTSDKVAYTLNDSRGNRIASGTADFTKDGGFDLEVALPANVNLGTARFTFETKQQAISHPISIEEFRTPAYAVNLADDVQFSGARPLFLGESLQMSSEAKYYAGGGLGGSAISWSASLQSATYRPPGWDRYSFSRVRPRSERTYWNERYAPTSTTTADAEGSLSGASTSSLALAIAALPRGAPSVLTVDATVTDVDRQIIRASSRKILVHPSTLYVGMRLKPDALKTLQLIVTDLDGNLVAGVPIAVEIEGVLGSEQYRDDAEVIDTQSCKLVSAKDPVECTFTYKDRQTAYSGIARITDARGRANEAQYNIPWWIPADKDLAIVPDKQMYKPGDVAKLEVKSKILPATAVVSFARQGVLVQKRIEMTAESTAVELPIEPAYVQNVHVLVDRVAKRRYQNGGSPLPLPEHQSASIELDVDVESARLSMRTRSLQPLIEPGDDASFEVEVKHDDKPVAGAEVALIVVDEAILAISGKKYADPLEPFYRDVRDGTQSMSTMSLVMDSGYELKGGPGFERWRLDDGTHGSGTGTGYGFGSGRGGMSGRSSSSPSVRIGDVAVKARKDFRPTAVFSPRLQTDANGKVKLTVKMPDSLTRYRILALATANTRYFGKAESNIVAQRKVNARTVAPRFLTQGDTFSLPVVVQNLDAAPRTIDVAVRAGNLASTGPAGKRVTVPGGQRAEVRFEFATQDRGKAVIQTIASASGFVDASNVEIPVYTPATTESFATYGSIDDKPAFEQLAVPASIFTEVGGVEAELSSTQMQNLTDAFWYLYAYPFECAEQRSSRMLATSAMYDILEAFATGARPTRKELEATRASDVKRLARDQQNDGGWGYFGGMKSDPFVSLQVLMALAAQKDKSDTTKRAIEFATRQATTLLGDLEKKAKVRDVRLQRRADDAAMISLAAASLSAISAAGTDTTMRAERLHAAAMTLGTYPVDAKARLLAIVAKNDRHKPLRAKLLADLLSAVHETAAAATVTATFTEAERLLLVSENKTTALTLDALLREQPDHALITKLARGLLDARRGGRWHSTQENVVVLQALRRYFDVYEKDTPNFTGKLWLGNTAYAEQLFAGRSNVRAVTHADWSMLAPGTTHDIALQKTGPGRMYYRLGITYAPKDTNLPPLDAGFIVRRTYKPVDAPSDVVQLPDGRWKVKLGARVLVRLEAINTTTRHAVALVDPLPAGFEAVNARLATAERAVVDLDADRWDYESMRDNRSEVFSMQLGEGTHRFSYTARATTPGTFIAAPAKAEEMYSPETFGRSGGTTVVIE
jgi:uncharacterized protein YfaS (alpha-2-macroglobulin family)